MSKFPRYVCFEPEQGAGVSIGGNLYWITLDGSVLNYNSESETAELISAPEASAGLEAKSIHCGANRILVYCARDRITEEVVIWELINQKTWVARREGEIAWCGAPPSTKNFVCLSRNAGLVLSDKGKGGLQVWCQ